MGQDKNIDRKSRASEKAVSRKRDAIRLQNGESPEVLQQENSIFSRGFFKNGEISNLAESVGR